MVGGKTEELTSVARFKKFIQQNHDNELLHMNFNRPRIMKAYCTLEKQHLGTPISVAESRIVCASKSAVIHFEVKGQKLDLGRCQYPC